MSDISSLKWAESYQVARVEEAVEAKRQQERFIDVREFLPRPRNLKHQLTKDGR